MIPMERSLTFCLLVSKLQPLRPQAFNFSRKNSIYSRLVGPPTMILHDITLGTNQ